MGCGILLSTTGVYLVCANSGDALIAQKYGQDQMNSGAEEQPPAALVTAAADQQLVPASQYRKLSVGYLLAFANVLLDVVGSVLTKRFGRTLNTFEINALRFGFAALCMGLVFAVLNLRHRESNVKGEARVSPEGGTYDELGGHSAPTPAPVWYRMPSAPGMTRRSWVLVALGVCLVTFLCPALSNYALFQISIGASMRGVDCVCLCPMSGAC